jgi:hypothetical protein
VHLPGSAEENLHFAVRPATPFGKILKQSENLGSCEVQINESRDAKLL